MGNGLILCPESKRPAKTLDFSQGMPVLALLQLPNSKVAATHAAPRPDTLQHWEGAVHFSWYTFSQALSQYGRPERAVSMNAKNLTAKVYTDASQLPTFDAVASLDWEEDSYTQPRTQSAGADGQRLSSNGTKDQGENVAKRAEIEPPIPVLTSIVTNCRMVEPRGFEPLTPTMPLWCSTN